MIIEFLMLHGKAPLAIEIVKCGDLSLTLYVQPSHVASNKNEAYNFSVGRIK
jgi:hypothetical protein